MAEIQGNPEDDPAQIKSRKKKRSNRKGRTNGKARARRRSFGVIPRFATLVLAVGGILAIALMFGRLVIVRR